MSRWFGGHTGVRAISHGERARSAHIAGQSWRLSAKKRFFLKQGEWSVRARMRRGLSRGRRGNSLVERIATRKPRRENRHVVPVTASAACVPSQTIPLASHARAAHIGGPLVRSPGHPTRHTPLVVPCVLCSHCVQRVQDNPPGHMSRRACRGIPTDTIRYTLG